jgi:hypothetical protein
VTCRPCITPEKFERWLAVVVGVGLMLLALTVAAGVVWLLALLVRLL